MNDINILIVEDEPIIAEDIATMLRNADYEVGGIAYTPEEVYAELTKSKTDLVLLDINLDGAQEGIEIAKALKSTYNIPFIFLTSYSDRNTVSTAKKTEPCGYIVKPFSEASLFTTIEIALVNFAQRMKVNNPTLLLDVNKINAHLTSPLSEREFEVLMLIYDGKTNQQIASTLFVTINTIKKHINNAYLKIDATTRSNAIARLRKLST
jgi:DNA-binding NarL/FixJ family response regulator